MVVLEFLLSLIGATMLLLFAVRLVRTGIERAFGSSFQRLMTRNSNPANAGFVGMLLAVVLQSSAAVAVLVSGFATNGSLSVSTGIAAVIGADLGSAIVVQMLSLPVDWLIPGLLAMGGGLYLKTRGHNIRQFGRVLLGIGLILIALQLLRSTVEPIRYGQFMPSIAAYLGSDLISAFLLGAVMAFIMYSSVAVVLMTVAIIAVTTLPFSAAVAIVLGANLGGALVPIWLTRDLPQPGNKIPIANLLIRGSTAILALSVLIKWGMNVWPQTLHSAQGLVLLHLGFNAVLLLYLPFTSLISNLIDRLVMKNVAEDTDPLAIWNRSALDPKLIDSPQFAISCVHREVLRMGQLIEHMVNPVMELYANGQHLSIKRHMDLDEHVNQALSGIRQYVSDIGEHELIKSDRRKLRQLTEYAINLEACGDIVAKRLMPLALEKERKGIQFSDEGHVELMELHSRVVANMTLAFNVLVSEDVDAARQLLLEKSAVSARERNSRKRHLKRILAGTEKSLESSDIHLETLRALKDLNSQIASVSYPILHRNGQLLENRLLDHGASETEPQLKPSTRAQ